MCNTHQALPGSEQRALSIPGRRLDRAIPPAGAIAEDFVSLEAPVRSIEDKKAAVHAELMAILNDEEALSLGLLGPRKKHARPQFKHDALRRLERSLSVQLPKGSSDFKYKSADLELARNTLLGKLGELFGEEAANLLPRFLKKG